MEVKEEIEMHVMESTIKDKLALTKKFSTAKWEFDLTPERIKGRIAQEIIRKMRPDPTEDV